MPKETPANVPADHGTVTLLVLFSVSSKGVLWFPPEKRHSPSLSPLPIRVQLSEQDECARNVVQHIPEVSFAGFSSNRQSASRHLNQSRTMRNIRSDSSNSSSIILPQEPVDQFVSFIEEGEDPFRSSLQRQMSIGLHRSPSRRRSIFP